MQQGGRNRRKMLPIAHFPSSTRDFTPDASAPTKQCRSCGSRRRGSKMVLCDQCQDGFHIWCLDRPLLRLPTDGWLCKRHKGNAPSHLDTEFFMLSMRISYPKWSVTFVIMYYLFMTCLLLMDIIKRIST